MPNNSNYQFRAVPLNLIDYVKKKNTSSQYYFRYLLDRTMMMFEYKNLPDTIVPSILERYLQVNGVACITDTPKGLFCFNGSWGGEQDVYYRPTRFIVANPHISQLTDDKTFTKEVVIYGDEPHTGVLLRNDTEWASLTPLIARYAVLMAENCLTIRSADIMLRILAMLTAGTDKERKSAEAYLAKIEAGELGVIGTNAFKQSVQMQSPPSNNGSYLTQFIELQQYLKGSFFNELGLRANYNMKREAIGAGESTLDADAILPLCDNMLKCRREDISQLNELFNLNVTVDFSSAWLENRLESSATIISQLTEAGVIPSLNTEGGVGDDTMGAEFTDEGNEGDVGDGAQGSQGSQGSEIEKEGNEKNDKDKHVANGDGTSVEEVGRDGDSRERAGDENSEDREPAERGVSEEGRRGEEASEEGSNKVSQEEIDKVRGELSDNNMSLVEGLVEVMENKVSQLIAEVREGGEKDGIPEEVSETEGLPTPD